MTCSNEYWQCATPAVSFLQGAAVVCSTMPTEHDTNPFNSEELEQRAALSLFYSQKTLMETTLNVASERLRSGALV